MLQNHYAASNITTVYNWSNFTCLCQLKFIVLNFQDLNRPKIDTLLCDVTMTLTQQYNIGKVVFFLRRNTFPTRKCMFDTLPIAHTGLHSGLH